LGSVSAVGDFWAQTYPTPVVTATLAKITILARMLFETFLLVFRKINFSL
jgi:hypothetical protein